MDDNQEGHPSRQDDGQSDPGTSASHESEAGGYSLPPATLEALRTLSTLSAAKGGIEELQSCDKLTAILEQIRSKKNIKLFKQLNELRKDFSGLDKQISQMEASITNLKEVTNNLVKSLPSDHDVDIQTLEQRSARVGAKQ